MRDYGLDRDEFDSEFNQWLNGTCLEKLASLSENLFTTHEEESYQPKPLPIKKLKLDEYGNEIEDDGYRNPGGGFGRPHSINRASKSISIRTTPYQHEQFLALGGCKWIKKIIEEASR